MGSDSALTSTVVSHEWLVMYRNWLCTARLAESSVDLGPVRVTTHRDSLQGRVVCIENALSGDSLILHEKPLPRFSAFL